MKKNVGSVLLIFGIVLVILSTVNLIHLQKPTPKTSTLWQEYQAWRGMHPHSESYESTRTWIATKRRNTYVLFGVGIALAIIGITVSIKQEPDEKSLLAVPLEYFGKAMIGFTVARIGASVLLVWALSEHAYEYYTILRFVVCGTTAYGIFLAVRSKRVSWAWIFGIVAVLFNPIIPIHLERGTWAVIDVCVAVLLVVSIFLFRFAGTSIEATSNNNH